MTDSLERFLQDLRFDLPSGFVDRVKAGAATRSQPTERSGAVMSRRTELAVGIAAVVIAAIMIGTFAYIRAVTGSHTIAPASPAMPEAGVTRYQAVIAADEQRSINFLNYQCTVNPGNSTPCADAAALAIVELQQWLDDLNQTRPPDRFAAIDGRMRHHLAVAIADLRALIAANVAMDDTKAATAVANAQSERFTLDREASAVNFSKQETIRSYVAVVLSDSSNVLACDLCQRLAGQTQVSCLGKQPPSCADEITATSVLVETFQDDLVRNLAPVALAAKDQRLQADLLAADSALNALSSALSAGDQLQLVAGQNALRQALNRVDADASGISNPT